MTRQMALELAPHRIRVNAIAPGLTDTAQPRYGSTEEEIAEMAAANPLGRIAQPEDIARAARVPRLRQRRFRHRAYPPCQWRVLSLLRCGFEAPLRGALQE